MEVGSGYVREILTVLMPILLGLAILYASFRTWQFRKHTRHRIKRRPDDVIELEEPARVEQGVWGIILWSVITFTLFVAVIVIFFW